MPTLQQLKGKWFIPIDGLSPNFVPQRRHTDNPGGVSVSTDNNLVTPLIDGAAYMARWHNKLVVMHIPTPGEFQHSAWRFDDVKPLGATSPGPNGLEDIDNADGNSVVVYPLFDNNIACFIINQISVQWLRLHGVWTAVWDNRFPPRGSNHQKFAVFKHTTDPIAVLGSIDIARSRWDTPAHAVTNPDRPSFGGKRTHDTGVVVQGPALADIEKTFRERWNDSSRTWGMLPLLPPQPLITTPVVSPPNAGGHSVQALRTYGITTTSAGYSWSPRGEFTVWASYLNAIQKAATYIYIEDQYFYPFHWPPCHIRTGTVDQATDLIFQLGEAIRHGVKVAIVTPNSAEDWGRDQQKYQRDIGVTYLKDVKAAGAPGDVVVASLKVGAGTGTSVYIHSKLMIVDDEFVLIGSTNVGQRSMTYDSELHIGVVDPANTFAKEFRKALWAEHTGRAAATLDDPNVAYALFQGDTAANTHHLTPYPNDTIRFPGGVGSPPVPAPPRAHAWAITTIIDPYAGPAGMGR